MDTTTVYWGLFVRPDEFANRALLTKPPVRVISDLKDIYNPESKAFSCPAVRNKHKNTFVYKLPFDVSVSVRDGVYQSKHLNTGQRQSMYKGGFSFDIDYQLIFYSFEELLLETSPPYMHQSPWTALGHTPSGSFNIGRWFRPSAPNISVYPNIESIELNQSDPLIYYNFVTDKQVVLQQFFVTDYLFDIAMNLVNHKLVVPNEPLDSLYDKFEDGKIDTLVQREILDNLLGRS